MPDEAAIQRALADLAKQDQPNFSETARSHGVDRNTLSRRYKGQTEALAVARLNSQGKLTAIQEEAVVSWIDSLSKKKLPPTPGMITNYVEGLIGEEIGKADADFTREITGFAIGGIPPIGHKQTIETYIDEDLLQYEEVWAAAGTPHAVFSLSSALLEELTGGKIVSIK